jgi:REP element-mobilizing transposase RayT
MEKIKTKYRRNLPQIQPRGFCFFVTFSLKGAIPKHETNHLKIEYAKTVSSIKKIQHSDERNLKMYLLRRKYIHDLDIQMHNNTKGPNYLIEIASAEILKNQLESYNAKYYDLLAYTIMPNHVHILIDLGIQINEETGEPKSSTYINLHKIMNLIKGSSARYINLERGTIGQRVWESESFDIYIRNERMLNNVVSYIIENPVRARLPDTFKEYPYTFVKYR